MISCLRNVLGSGEFSRPTFKCELTDPMANLGGSALGAITGLIGNIWSNNTNKKLTRETNAQNYQIWKESKEFNEMMQDKQNQYNSANAQVARYREAGINPYLAMYGNGGNAGIQNAAVSAPSAPQMQAPQVRNPVAMDEFSYMYNALANMATIRKTNAEAEGQETDNETRHVENMARIRNILAQGDKYGMDTRVARRQLYEMEESWKKRDEAYGLQNNLYRAQYDSIYDSLETAFLQRKTMELQMQLDQKLNEAQIKAIQQSIKESAERVNLLIKEGKVKEQEAYNVFLDTLSKGLDNNLKGLDLNDKHNITKKTSSILDKENSTFYLNLLLKGLSVGAQFIP